MASTPKDGDLILFGGKYGTIKKVNKGSAYFALAPKPEIYSFLTQNLVPVGEGTWKHRDY